MNTVNPQHPWGTRLLTALAQLETERGWRVWLRLFSALVMAAALLWFTVRPFGDTVPPIYWLGFRTGWIIASLILPLGAFFGGLAMHLAEATPIRQGAGRHWFIAGVILFLAAAPASLSPRFLHPLATGHWTLGGSQVVLLVFGAFMGLAIMGALLAIVQAGVALLGTAPIWGARRWLRRRGLSPSGF